MNGVASDALENQRRSLLNEATAEHQMRKIMRICKNISRVFNATCQKFNKTYKSSMCCEQRRSGKFVTLWAQVDGKIFFTDKSEKWTRINLEGRMCQEL